MSLIEKLYDLRLKCLLGYYIIMSRVFTQIIFYGFLVNPYIFARNSITLFSWKVVQGHSTTSVNDCSTTIEIYFVWQRISTGNFYQRGIFRTPPCSLSYSLPLRGHQHFSQSANLLRMSVFMLT